MTKLEMLTAIFEGSKTTISSKMLKSNKEYIQKCYDLFLNDKKNNKYYQLLLIK